MTSNNTKQNMAAQAMMQKKMNEYIVQNEPLMPGGPQVGNYMMPPFNVPGSMDRYGSDIYLEDAMMGPGKRHVDMPGYDNMRTFDKSYYRYNAFAGSVVPHEGLVELMDSERLKKQVAMDRWNNAYSPKPKHSHIHNLMPGFIPDFRPPHAKSTADFGGLEATEVVDGEQKLRLYTTYTAMPGIGLYGNSYQSMYF